MAAEQSFKAFFESEAFVSHYKTGEMITGTFARTLIEQSGIITESKSKPEKPLVVLDNACGTGAVSSILHHDLDDNAKKQWKLTCGDISEGMLAYTRNRIKDEGWQNVQVKTVDAQSTGLPGAHFTHVFTAFAYMALPHSLAALDESLRILQPGGTIAFSTWIEPGWLSVVKRAVETIPGNLPFPTPQEFLSVIGDGQWNSVSWIESQLQQRRFEDVNVKIDSKHISLTKKKLLETSMVMFPLVVQRFWTAEQREQNESKVQPALAQYLEDTYGDGVVPMDWIAILSTARKSC